MNQELTQKQVDAQVNYLGRWVSRDNFRVFVYGKEGQKKVVENYDEYEKAILSREWFAHIDDIKKVTKKEATKNRLVAVEPTNSVENSNQLVDENESQATEA